jgi:hypothetical protein
LVAAEINMDVYSTSFTYPCPRNLSSSSPTHDGSSDGPHLDAPDAKAIENVNQLAMMAQTLHGVHISFNQASHPGCWNWYISGAYQQVMTARGMILKEGPIQVILPRSPHSHYEQLTYFFLFG